MRPHWEEVASTYEEMAIMVIGGCQHCQELGLGGSQAVGVQEVQEVQEVQMCMCGGMTSRVHREPKAVKLRNVSVSPRLEWTVDATPAGCGLLQALFLLRKGATCATSCNQPPSHTWRCCRKRIRVVWTASTFTLKAYYLTKRGTSMELLK